MSNSTRTFAPIANRWNKPCGSTSATPTSTPRSWRGATTRGKGPTPLLRYVEGDYGCLHQGSLRACLLIGCILWTREEFDGGEFVTLEGDG